MWHVCMCASLQLCMCACVHVCMHDIIHVCMCAYGMYSNVCACHCVHDDRCGMHVHVMTGLRLINTWCFGALQRTVLVLWGPITGSDQMIEDAMK